MSNTAETLIDRAFAGVVYRVFWRTPGARHHDEQSVTGAVNMRALQAHLQAHGFETSASLGSETPCPWNDFENETGEFSRAAYMRR